MRELRLLLPILLLTAGHASAQPVYSVIFENARVVDGTGAPEYEADVAVSRDRIAAIGDLTGRRAALRVDATGLVLTPGFIDIHSHAPGSGGESALANRPNAPNLVRQGVTSVFGGQDGSSPVPVGGAMGFYEAFPAVVNVGFFVGHGSIRGRVLGPGSTPADAHAMAEMAELVAQGMRDGAFGLSSGLEYAPGMFADTEELVTLAAASAPWGGLYISHVRDEGGGLMDSVEELIRIAREAGVPAQLTHHKIIGKSRWGGTRESLERVASARAEGLDISVDVYPYTASSTGMTILFPGWSKDGGLAALQDRLADSGERARIRQEVIARIHSERGSDPASIVAASCGFDPGLAGKSLADMSRERGLPATVEAAADVAIDLVERGSCQGVFHSMSEDDVVRVLQFPHAMVASDGGVPRMGAGSPHPRSYGSFARILERFVRETGALTLEDAVRKMSGAPAERLGLHDRGRIAPGLMADLVLLDPDSVSGPATFVNPHQLATGVQAVLVNGSAVLWEGEPTGARPGRVLRRSN